MNCGPQRAANPVAFAVPLYRHFAEPAAALSPARNFSTNVSASRVSYNLAANHRPASSTGGHAFVLSKSEDFSRAPRAEAVLALCPRAPTADFPLFLISSHFSNRAPPRPLSDLRVPAFICGPKLPILPIFPGPATGCYQLLQSDRFSAQFPPPAPRPQSPTATTATPMPGHGQFPPPMFQWSRSAKPSGAGSTGDVAQAGR